MYKTTILIPAYNEEKNILDLLTQVNKQANDQIQVCIIVNGSTDKTERYVRTFFEKYKLKAKFKLMVSKTPGKTRAINLGLRNSHSKYVIHLDADCKLSENLIENLIRSLDTNAELKLIGALDYPLFDNLNKGSLLYQFLMVQQILKEEKGRSMPVGRWLAYHRDLVDKFPLNIHSEDNWIALTTAKKYGWDSVKVFKNLKIYYNPPLNWVDFIKQETKFDQGYLQIIEQYKNLLPIYNSRRKNYNKQMIRTQILERLRHEDLDISILDNIEGFIGSIIVGNSKLMANQIITKNGSWIGITSTK